MTEPKLFSTLFGRAWSKSDAKVPGRRAHEIQGTSTTIPLTV